MQTNIKIWFEYVSMDIFNWIVAEWTLNSYLSVSFFFFSSSFNWMRQYGADFVICVYNILRRDLTYKVLYVYIYWLRLILCRLPFRSLLIDRLSLFLFSISIIFTFQYSIHCVWNTCKLYIPWRTIQGIYMDIKYRLCFYWKHTFLSQPIYESFFFLSFPFNSNDVFCVWSFLFFFYFIFSFISCSKHFTENLP